MLHDGLYEQVINKGLDSELASADKLSQTAPIDTAEASKVLAKYVAEVVERGLDNLRDNGGDLNAQVALANQIITTIQAETKEADFDSLSVAERAEQLLALFDRQNSIWALDEKAQVIRPETSIAQSSLFTGAVHEPQMYTELKKEIVSCNRIDMLVSFIKWSGLRLIMDELTTFTQKGGELRIITTSYMGATDVKAIEELHKLPNTKIKVSYDTKRTRLHAKTYVFYRDTGFTTAYVGSSNLSSVAISSGLEWNVKVTKQDLPETIDKIAATFESYWNSNEFEYYDEGQRERLARALHAEKYYDSNNPDIYTMDIQPYSYQQEILDKLEAERTVRGYMRNLIVAATGTGKTVISALDYKRFRRHNTSSPCRLLFVAHREEILKQSMYTFRAVLKDANFGEMFVGSFHPNSLDNLFISVQTFNSQDFTSKTSPDYYDFIIVDEFHHAAAPTYQKLLEYYRPKIMLGLTATPERMDGKSILPYFDNRIAAEIRLPEAIDRKLLCPFQYFGVTDTVDLDKLKWSAGGYDKGELSRVYTLSGLVAKRRADLVVTSLMKYVTDIDEVKGLGFCVSVEHAEFMCRYFNEHGIPSMFLTGKSPDEERHDAKENLVSGKVRFIFVVDIYNEGVDIPEVNTVLFLRPTESLTIFLQQLGRGLRLADGKECLTVLDFIGQANKKYNFEEKFAALLSHSTRSVQREVKDGFISAPKGCYIQLEKKAKEYILDNIRKSFGLKSGILSHIAYFKEDTGLELNLSNFLDHYHLDPRLIYSKKCTFTSLCAEAKIKPEVLSDLTPNAYKILFRLSTMDSAKWLKYILENLKLIESIKWDDLSATEQLMWKMLYISVWERPIDAFGFTSILDGIIKFKSCPDVYEEALSLLEYCYNHVSVVGTAISLPYPCPLEVHCTYTRAQILAAFDFIENYTISEGVTFFRDKDTDIFFTTLNKADKYYSPTTAYNDYSINQWLFHWQSQSTTSEDSPTGKRYRNRRKNAGCALLFARERKSDNYGAQPFVFLGPVYYVQHQGSRPMNITWKLEYPIPSKYIKVTNKLMPE